MKSAVASLIAACGLAGSAAAAPQHDSVHAARLEVVAEDVVNLSLAGPLLYLSNFVGGFTIADVTEPAAPVAVGSFPMTGQPGVGLVYDVRASGTLALAAAGISGLVVVDVTQPELPLELGRRTFPNPPPATGNSVARCVAVQGTRAYVGTISRGIQVVDFAVPALPVTVGAFIPAVPTVRATFEIAIDGSTLYMANHLDGLRILSLADPLAPSQIAHYDTPGRAVGVVVHEGRAYVADDANGLVILDVTTPSAPSLIATLPIPGSGAGHVSREGSLLHVSAYEAGVLTYDLSAPSAPRLVSRSWFEGAVTFFGPPGAEAAVGRDGWLFSAWGADDLRVFDRRRPASLVRRQGVIAPGAASGVAVSSPHAWVARGSAGVATINVADPAALTPLGSFDTPGTARSVATLTPSSAVVADDTAGVHLLVNPAAPVLAGTFPTPTPALDIAPVSGTVAAVAAGTSGLLLVSFADPATPQLVGSVDTPGAATAVITAGSLAIVADGEGGVLIVSLANPAAPAVIGGILTSASAVDVALVGPSTLAAAIGAAGVAIIDLTAPAAPVFLTEWRPSGSGKAVSVAATGRWLAVGMDEEGIDILDLANPGQPLRVTGSQLAGGRSLAFSGTTLFAAAEAFSGIGAAEYFASLQFIDPAGLPRLANPRATMAGFTVDLEALPGTSVRIRRAVDPAGPWETWRTFMPADPVSAITDPDTASRRFYRAEPAAP